MPRTPTVPAVELVPGLSPEAVDAILGDTAADYPSVTDDGDLTDVVEPEYDPGPPDGETSDSVEEIAPRRRPRSPNGVRRPRKSRAKGAAGRTASAPKSRTPSLPRSKPIEVRVAAMLSEVGSVALVVGVNTGNVALFNDGAALTDGAKPLGDALGAVARENPAVAAFLDRMTTSSAYMGLALAVLPIAAAMARNHKLIALPDNAASMLGVAPEASAADMRAWVERQTASTGDGTTDDG